MVTRSKQPAYDTFRFKNDRFRKDRGGQAMMLEILCADCGVIVLIYQKDGYPNQGLFRCYWDRIFFPSVLPKKELCCPSCGQKIGTQMIYQKEDRTAYGLLEGTFIKRRLPDQRRFA